MTGAYTALCPEEINLGKRPQSHLLHGEFGSWHVSLLLFCMENLDLGMFPFCSFAWRIRVGSRLTQPRLLICPTPTSSTTMMIGILIITKLKMVVWESPNIQLFGHT